MFWNKKPASNAQAAGACAKALYNHCYGMLKDAHGVRVEDLVSAVASIVGERCIEAAGDFNPRQHTFPPGQAVLSTKANELMCGDAELSEAPSTSIFGTLRDEVLKHGYTLAEFPALKSVFETYVGGVGTDRRWGYVPLSVPAEHFPRIMPLRVTYESRRKVDEIIAPVGADVHLRLLTVNFALAQVLVAVAGAIDHRLVLTLALETINGMSKTAPMTDEAMAKVQAEAQVKKP